MSGSKISEATPVTPCADSVARALSEHRPLFVHISAVRKAGLNSLNEGQVVEYEEVAKQGKNISENLKV
jgi:cold shock CspA family protein